VKPSLRQSAICSAAENIRKAAPQFDMDRWKHWCETAPMQEKLAIWPVLWFRFEEIRRATPMPHDIRIGPPGDLPKARAEEILLSLGFAPWAAAVLTTPPESRYDNERPR
jgi:hypothetical protein